MIGKAGSLRYSPPGLCCWEKWLPPCQGEGSHTPGSLAVWVDSELSATGTEKVMPGCSEDTALSPPAFLFGDSAHAGENWACESDRTGLEWEPRRSWPSELKRVPQVLGAKTGSPVRWGE